MLHVGTKKKIIEYEMSGVKLENVSCVEFASNLKFSQHCKDAAGKANRMLGSKNFFFSRINM